MGDNLVSFLTKKSW